MTRLHILKVKVTIQGPVINPSTCVRSISPKPFSRTRFIKLHSNVPLSETVCRVHDPATLTQGQGHCTC